MALINYAFRVGKKILSASILEIFSVDSDKEAYDKEDNA